MKIKRIFPICFLFLASCQMDRNDTPIDSTPYRGCYFDGAQVVKISAKNFIINNKNFNYDIEWHKIGIMVRISAEFKNKSNNILDIYPSSQHLFRIINSNDKMKLVLIDQNAREYFFSHQDCGSIIGVSVTMQSINPPRMTYRIGNRHLDS